VTRTLDDKEIAGDATVVFFRKDAEIMRKIVMILTTIVIVGLLLGATTIPARAYDWQEYYENLRAKREQQEKEFTEKWLDELEADGNLTPEAIKAAGKYGEGRVPNHKSTGGSKSGSYVGESSGTTTSGKRWVYSADELHVIGLPEGSNGYTKPGYYGDVNGTYSSDYSGSGKGWVYSADELHVIGLPEGEDGYTLPGWYGDID